MAQFTIHIPDDKVQDLLNAFAAQYNYQEEIDDPNNPEEKIPNPVSKSQCAKDIVKKYIKEVFVAGRLKAIEETRQAMIAQAQADIQDVDVT